MVPAVLFYVLGGVALLGAEQWLARLAHGDTANAWLNLHVYTPLLRAALVMGFVLIAYPQLLGLASAPSLGELLSGGRYHDLLTTGLAISLMIPLLPGTAAVPSAVVTVQGIASAGLLATWLAPHVGLAEPRLWMGWAVAFSVLAVLVAGDLFGRFLLWLTPMTARSGRRAVVLEAARLAAELPAVLIYALALGEQFRELT